MYFLDIQGRRYVQFERLRQETGLLHAFSTRPANVSPHSGPDAAGCAERRWTMAADFGLDPTRLRYCQQAHEARIAVLDDARIGGPLPSYDGVVTHLGGVPLMTFSADCPLVIVYDPVRPALGLAHASWRCTLARLAGRLIEVMISRLGCPAPDLLAGVGPGAGPCCYEVQTGLYAAATTLPDRDRFFQRRGGRLYFDLWQANRVQLVEAGVRPENVEVAGLCTLCHNDVFYSYRREGAGCGHFGLLGALVPTTSTELRVANSE
jgi:hypothetical protein